MSEFNNVYKGKTVLVTGHTGFKGSLLNLYFILNAFAQTNGCR